jgi:hypothetical protein
VSEERTEELMSILRGIYSKLPAEVKQTTKVIQVRGQSREIRMGIGGIEMRQIDQPWPNQYLTYYDLGLLIELKNEAFSHCNGDMAAGEKLWRENVARQIFGKKTKAAKKATA